MSPVPFNFGLEGAAGGEAASDEEDSHDGISPRSL